MVKTIILAGGKATRLPNSAKEIPKVLVGVQGKPLLLHQIDRLREQGFYDIRLSLGVKAGQIKDYLHKRGEEYEYVIENEPLGTGGAIKKACEELEDDFMVLNGDILADIDFQQFWQQHQDFKTDHKDKVFGTIAVWHSQDCRDFGQVRISGNRITEFLEKPKEECEGYINAGFYILSPQALKSHQEAVFSIEHSFFPKLAGEGRLFVYIHQGKWIDVGTEERLKIAREGRL